MAMPVITFRISLKGSFLFEIGQIYFGLVYVAVTRIDIIIISSSYALFLSNVFELLVLNTLKECFMSFISVEKIRDPLLIIRFQMLTCWYCSLISGFQKITNIFVNVFKAKYSVDDSKILISIQFKQVYRVHYNVANTCRRSPHFFISIITRRYFK